MQSREAARTRQEMVERKPSEEESAVCESCQQASKERTWENMSLVKRGKTWHTHFFIDGQRFRQSLDTSDWREAQAREKELITQASQGKLAPASQQFGRLAFGEAADRFLESRRLDLSEASQKKEKQVLVQPRRFFGAQTLHKITTENLVGFREWRVKAGVGPAIINMEMGVIRRMLKKAKRWHLVGAEIKPLREPRSIGRALAHSEKVKLLAKAKSRPEWHNARLAGILALNTTMRGCEIKNLRWRDIDLLTRVLSVRKSKTEAGERTIPINDAAFAAIRELRERAQPFSGTEPEHFLFPACEHERIDPTRPMKSWRSAWRQITKAAGIPGLRFHDLRHHAITELAESQASDQTIMSVAGHVSQRMLARYSHVRMEAKRQALDALSGGGERQGYDTKNDTKGDSAFAIAAEVIERNGRHEETRTPDLYRVKVAL
jgi:integrase